MLVAEMPTRRAPQWIEAGEDKSLKDRASASSHFAPWIHGTVSFHSNSIMRAWPRTAAYPSNSRLISIMHGGREKPIDYSSVSYQRMDVGTPPNVHQLINAPDMRLCE